jgi:hypothetical protein
VFVPSKIIYDVCDLLLNEKLGFFWHELNRKTKEDILLWNLRDAADEGPADVVSSAKVSHDLDVE